MADATDESKNTKGKTEGLSKVAVDKADDELTNGQFIDRHFARGDMNLNQMAERLDMDTLQVVSILRELGYGMPESHG